MSYAARIQAGLHDRYSGLKQGVGLAWLNKTLCRLNAAGLNQAVRQFLNGMGNIARMPGFLLEVELLDCLMETGYSGSELQDERCEGTCTRPVDAAVQEATNRASFQCKFINSYLNELHVASFERWVHENYSADNPGAFFHFQATVEADRYTFHELRAWFTSNHASMNYGPRYVFRETNGRAIRISKHRSKTPGYELGTITSAAKDGEVAYKEDIPLVRAVLEERLLDSIPTFGFMPSGTQQNFVVIDVDSLAMMGERQIYYALYGQDQMSKNLAGKWVEGNDGKGLFASGNIDQVSAVILLRRHDLGNYDAIIFPHPSHRGAVEPWLKKKGFRLGQSSRK